MKSITLISLILLSFGCGDKNTINKDFNREGETLSVRISTASSEKEMRDKAWEYEKGIQGQALYSPNDNKCEIVIYKPKRVDDEATLTLGHELMQCLYGDYHD